MGRASRSASPSSSEGHLGRQRWLLPYADVVTLLFALFAYQYFLGTGQAGTTQSTPSPTPTASAAVPAPPLVPSPVASPPTTPTIAGADWKQGIEQQLRGALRGVDGHIFQIYREERGVILVLSDTPLLFRSASSQLTPAGKDLLRRIAPVLQNVEARLLIEGHADSLPLKDPVLKDNWELSVWRAAAVARGLLRLGVEPDRISLMGYGDRRPVSSNLEASGREHNRRVELIFQFSEALSSRLP